MQNRFIPLLDVLEDKLPPSKFSALAEVAGLNEATQAMVIAPKPGSATK